MSFEEEFGNLCMRRKNDETIVDFGDLGKRERKDVIEALVKELGFRIVKVWDGTGCYKIVLQKLT